MTSILTDVGAALLTKKEAPQIHSMARSLATLAGLPMPSIFVVDVDSPIAFALGFSPRSAAIVMTRGLTALQPEVIKGALAHEIAHIHHGDIMRGTLSAMVASLLCRGARSGGNLRGLRTRIARWVARKGRPLQVELRADATAVRWTGAPSGLIRALDALASSPGPDSLPLLGALAPGPVDVKERIHHLKELGVFGVAAHHLP